MFFLQLQNISIYFIKHLLSMKKIIPLATILLIAACGEAQKNETTTLTGNWIEVMPSNPQIIQGVTLNADGSASSIGMATLLYESWKQKENSIILNGKSVGNGQTISFSDTLDIISHTTDSLILGKYGMYRREYYRVDNPESVKPFNVLDSLRKQPDAGPVVKDIYKGTLPAASCPGIEYTITIHHQEHSGDGVFQASLNYLEAENGKDKCYNIYGRQYTLRGDASDKNATVIQLVPFDGSETMNFRKTEGKLEMLDKDMKKIDSKLNYTLKKSN